MNVCPTFINRSLLSQPRQLIKQTFQYAASLSHALKIVGQPDKLTNQARVSARKIHEPDNLVDSIQLFIFSGWNFHKRFAARPNGPKLDFRR